MNALIATELMKLRLTRATWGFVVAAVLLPAARMAFVVTSAGTAAGVTRGTTAATVTMLGAAGLGSLVLLLFGATAVSGEFRHGTVTATLLNTPRRRSMILAKAAAYAAVGATAGTVLVILALACAAVTGLGVQLHSDVVHAAVATVLGAVLLTLLGVGIGLLARNQTVALLVPVVWLLLIEPMTRSFGLRLLTPWLPGALPGEIGPVGAAAPPSPLLAAVVLAGYVLAIGLLGARRLERADIA
jgi:ABC-2 type transport system permease protein